MQIVIMLNGEDPLPLHVPAGGDVLYVKNLLEGVTGISVDEQEISFNGALISSGQLTSIGIAENDILVLTKKSKRTINISDIRLDTPPEEIMLLVQQHPHLKTQFMNADPEFGEALGDIAKLRGLIMKRIMLNSKAGFEKEQRIRAIESDPNNEENQRLIAEQIRMENVQANMEVAIEELPEAFGRVIMLYVDVEINGLPIKAFVDSGAQSTIMSASLAERCGIMRLIDHRFAGEARGVGTAKILGRVHIAQMKVDTTFFPISITILENSDVEFLFGLDMLKRYRCEISLKSNELRIESSSGVIAVPFLSEKDLPSNARGTTRDDLEQPYKSSTSIGKSSSSSSDALSERTVEAPSTVFSPTSSSSSSVAPPLSSASPSSAAAAASAVMSVEVATGQGDIEGKVAQLAALGFPEQVCRAALEQANGDVDIAATLLLSSL